MVRFSDEHSSSASRIVNPWLSQKPSCRNQTAGDWYKVMLATALGGKVVHGCNSAPSVEVLCKAPSYTTGDTGVGYIRWDPTLADRPKIGNDISDQFYTHHKYRGSITDSGNILAYETGLWEPSTRSRAKATSLLAAGIHAHGCTIQDAVHSVSLIAGDDIDEEAVSSAILPASHLKREMTIVSKANHRIFTRGTIQSGLEWDDTNLSLGGYSQNVAFDWGRVTALARYIGEANVQSCIMFRRFAKSYGVPYFVVRDSWAYVSPFDYHLTPDLFTSVPRIDLAKYGIPSIKGAFVDHEDEVLIAVTRSLNERSLVPDSDTYEAYSKLHQAAKMRKSKRSSLKFAYPSEFLDESASAHTVTDSNLSDILETARIPYDSLKDAIANRIAKDPSFRRKLDSYRDSLSSGNESLVLLDDVSKGFFDKGTWILARAYGEFHVRELISRRGSDTELSESLVNVMLGKLKSEYFGRPTHIESTVFYSNKLLIDLRHRTRSLIKQVSEAPVSRPITQMSLIGADLREAADEIASLADKANAILPDVNSGVSTIFRDWANKIADSGLPNVVQYSANFYLTYCALRDLEVSDCMNEATGFIDGAAPRKSYVYRGMVELANMYGTIIPKLKKFLYASASRLAMELDEGSPFPFSLVTAVEYTTRVIQMVVGDIIVGQVYAPPDSILTDLYKDANAPDSPGYDVSMMTSAEDEAMLDAWMARVDEGKDIAEAAMIEQCLNSYPTASLADEYAKASGYADFKDAYGKLGEGTYYLEGSDYIINARAKVADAKGTSESGKKKRGYETLI